MCERQRVVALVSYFNTLFVALKKTEGFLLLRNMKRKRREAIICQHTKKKKKKKTLSESHYPHAASENKL